MLGIRTTIYKVNELGQLPEEIHSKDKATGVVAYWGVTNIENEYEGMIKPGAVEKEKPIHVGGELMTASVKDPWGNIIGLIYNPEFKITEI